MWGVLSPFPSKREGDRSLFLKIKHDLMRPVLCYGEGFQFFKTSNLFDQNTTMTYVLMDNFLSFFLFGNLMLSIRKKPQIHTEIYFAFFFIKSLTYNNFNYLVGECDTVMLSAISWISSYRKINYENILWHRE